MSKPAVIRAEFTDYRPVKTRKTLILSFEIPAEEQGAAFAALGYPVMGSSIWCAIARLQEGAGAPVPEKPAEPAPVEKAKAKRSNLAAIMCKENRAFQEWMIGHYSDNEYLRANKDEALSFTAERCLKEWLGIERKRELDDDDGLPAQAFDRLMTDFTYRNAVRS
jgi:hypothetical protein